jgi:hypothetical protein
MQLTRREEPLMTPLNVPCIEITRAQIGPIFKSDVDKPPQHQGKGGYRGAGHLPLIAARKAA